MNSRVQIRELRMLTVRQRAFLREKILGSNDKEAAIAAGYSPSVSENTKQKIWAKVQVVKEFDRLKQRFWVISSADERQRYIEPKRKYVPSGDPPESRKEIDSAGDIQVRFLGSA
jgi:hypothetical protein